MAKKNHWLYVLSLEQGKHYVGVTSKTPEIRFEEHKKGVRAAYWTMKYKPVSILDSKDLGEMTKEEAEAYENKVVRKYMKEKGVNNTRGGDLTDEEDYVKRFGRLYKLEDYKTLTIVLFMTIALGIASWALIFNDNQEEPTVKDDPTPTITSFEECVAAGNLIMESFPEQCAANGQTFVNEANLNTSQDTSESDTTPAQGNLLCSFPEWGFTFEHPEDWGECAYSIYPADDFYSFGSSARIGFSEIDELSSDIIIDAKTYNWGVSKGPFPRSISISRGYSEQTELEGAVIRDDLNALYWAEPPVSFEENDVTTYTYTVNTLVGGLSLRSDNAEDRTLMEEIVGSVVILDQREGWISHEVSELNLRLSYPESWDLKNNITEDTIQIEFTVGDATVWLQNYALGFGPKNSTELIIADREYTRYGFGSEFITYRNEVAVEGSNELVDVWVRSDDPETTRVLNETVAEMLFTFESIE